MPYNPNVIAAATPAAERSASGEAPPAAIAVRPHVMDETESSGAARLLYAGSAS